MKTLRTFGVVLALAAGAKATEPGRVRIAVMGLFHPNQLMVEILPGHPLLLTVGGRELKLSASASPAFLSRAGELVQVRAGGLRITTRAVTFAGAHGDTEFALAVPDRLRRVYRGRLMLRAEGRELVPLVEMDLETAVASVVAAEMPGETPLEALKAQAVVSRSYLVAGGPRHSSADFCDTTHCQFLREPPSPTSPAARATAATQGLVLAWQERPFAAMFSASCGGRTHSLAEIGYTQRDYPYFAVDCPYCRRAPQRWSSSLPQGNALPGDERQRIKTGRKLGWGTVPSPTFKAQTTPGGTLLSGVGRGHGAGLCQRGARLMAHEGKEFRAILMHYFPNATIQSLGPR